MRIWKRMLATALVATMFTMITGCGASNQDKKEGGAQTHQDTSLEDIKARGELVLGLDASFPPMGFTNDKNEIVGYDIDLATEVCKRMGVTLKVQPINWDSKQQELDTKNIDCIWNGMTTSEERQQMMTLSSTYMNNNQVLVVEANAPFQTKADLKDKVLELQKGSTAAAALEDPANADFKNSLKDMVFIADNVKAMMDLGTGCDAVLMDEVVANYYLSQHQGKYRLLEEPLSAEEYVIGFRKGEEALKNEVENQLKEMVKDGTMSEIDKKWFGVDVSTIQP